MKPQPSKTPANMAEREGLSEHGESLPEVRGTIAVPEHGGFWRNWRAFTGPALLVSVGYMDPGNWSTSLTAGAEFRYLLLWVVALSSGMAIILQICAAKLGVVTGKDLARASRDFTPRWTRWPNWLGAELAIGACDLAEVLGSAVAIHLLFPKVSILLGVLITAFDVMLLMGLQQLGFRKIESFIMILVATIAGCYFWELFVIGSAYHEFPAMGAALVRPSFGGSSRALFIAIGIIGATVMPHNLYLHSAIVQTRKYQRDESSIRRAIRFNAIDSVVALSLAFLVNASILVLAATTFYGKENLTLPNGHPIGDDWIQGAYHTLTPLLGLAAASILFAIALLASGQSSTVTGTLAGQVVMEGFMSWKMRPWLRRLVTRLLAIVPAVIVIGVYGDDKVTDLLNVSQVILGIQLPFAMIPLMYFTSRNKYMGRYVNKWFLQMTGWACVIVITALDLYLLGRTMFGME
ncbi:MAG: Nramp family divalent metal transporter [Phycisphaerales bacterium]|nr:Nramp family divalent metal transporter [Phycisphaerales bacterium]